MLMRQAIFPIGVLCVQGALGTHRVPQCGPAGRAMFHLIRGAMGSEVCNNPPLQLAQLVQLLVLVRDGLCPLSLRIDTLLQITH